MDAYDELARRLYLEVAHLCECGRWRNWICDVCWGVVVQLRNR